MKKDFDALFPDTISGRAYMGACFGLIAAAVVSGIPLIWAGSFLIKIIDR